MSYEKGERAQKLNPMAHILNLPSRPLMSTAVRLTSPSTAVRLTAPVTAVRLTQSRTLFKSFSCNGGRFTCLFSANNRNKEEKAKKALENALGGKKKELEDWDKEIKKREAAGGGGKGGGGGGWNRWFGGSNGDHFWQEAQQASLALLCILLVYLVVAKAEVLLAVTLNPLLFALRGPRNAFIFIRSWILQKVAPNAYSSLGNTSSEGVHARNSAKETVVRKWGSD